MNPTATILPRKRRVGRRRRHEVPSSPAPAGPVLVSATYNAGLALLSLVFDRAIDVTALVPGAIRVDDSVNAFVMIGSGDFSLTDPTTLEIVMIIDGDFEGEGVSLTATAATGIVAVDDAGALGGRDGFGVAVWLTLLEGRHSCLPLITVRRDQ